MRCLLFLVATAAFAGPPKIATDTAVVVSVEGQGTLPGGSWYGTRALVSSLFDSINVHLRWQQGTLPATGPPGVVVILVRFVGDAPPRSAKQPSVCASRTAFACSFPFDAAGPEIIVMHERVRLSTRPRLFQTLLAHTIAHEIAHVLGLRETHSDTGIMKEHWTVSDFYRMENAPLEFTPVDVEFIQDGFDYRRRKR